MILIKMDNIKVYDNFLSYDELETCKKMIKNNKWEYGHNSNGDTKVNTSFWVMDLKDNNFFNINLKEKIENIIGKKLKVDRVYANGQTFGLDGGFHQDSIQNNATTFCLYITPIPNDIIGELGGNILFKIPDIEHFSLALEPRYNRGVYFPSNFFHKVTAFNRYVQNMRICIAWKFTII